MTDWTKINTYVDFPNFCIATGEWLDKEAAEVGLTREVYPTIGPESDDSLRHRIGVIYLEERIKSSVFEMLQNPYPVRYWR